MMNRMVSNLSPISRTSLSITDSEDEDKSLDESSIKRMLTRTRPPPDKKRKPLLATVPVKQKSKVKITVENFLDEDK